MCPQAEQNLSPISEIFKNVSIKPTLKAEWNTFIMENRESNSNIIFKKIYDIAKNSFPKMKQGGLECNSFLGFKKIGATIVLYTNTPNNSLPLIWSNNNWSPLFTRHIRIKK